MPRNRPLRRRSYHLSFKLIAAYAPKLRVLAFHLSDGAEIIPDSLAIPVTPCLRNSVELLLSDKQVQIGSRVRMQLIGHPGSLCGLSAIDKSVTFMGKRNGIDLPKVR